jgi:hypothetical protein
VARLGDLTQLIRSKNAGPVLLTFDILFVDADLYGRVKATRVLGPDLFARLYRVPPDQVVFAAYDAALAFKATIPRPVPSGAPADTDVYGGRQFAPILDVEIPL